MAAKNRIYNQQEELTNQKTAKALGINQWELESRLTIIAYIFRFKSEEHLFFIL